MSNTTLNSAVNSTQKPKQGEAGLIVTNPSRLGDMAEQWVKLLAHWKGCEVFQNVGCTGPTDLVIVHSELGSVQIDVKCDSYSQSGYSGVYRWKQCTGFDIKPPVYVVRVTPDGDFSNWKARWRRGYHGKGIICPPGWEDFWSNDNRIYTTTSTQPTDA